MRRGRKKIKWIYLTCLFLLWAVNYYYNCPEMTSLSLSVVSSLSRHYNFKIRPRPREAGPHSLSTLLTFLLGISNIHLVQQASHLVVMNAILCCNSLRLYHCARDIMPVRPVMLRYQFLVIVLVTRENYPRYNITKYHQNLENFLQDFSIGKRVMTQKWKIANILLLQ